MLKLSDSRVNRIAHRILETLPVGGLIVDSAAHIAFANRDAADCFGFEDPAELEGRPLVELLPISIKQVDDALRACFSVKPERCHNGARAQVNGMRRDGTRVAVTVSVHPMHIADRDIADRDIADRRTAESSVAILYLEPSRQPRVDQPSQPPRDSSSSASQASDRSESRQPIPAPSVSNDTPSPMLAPSSNPEPQQDEPSGPDTTNSDHAKFVESERLAAVDQMASGLAHESRNAIQRARACLDLLELEVEGSAEHSGLLNGIRRALVDLNRNYEEVRSYAAPIILRHRSANLLHLFDETFTEFSQSAAQLLHCVDICDAYQYADAMIDVDRIKQVYRNLIDNSVAAAKGSASIQVSARDVRLRDRRAVRVSVTDRSGGIRERIANNIFEPFYTTKQHGTGLGLAVCRRIIDAHGGEIRAANNSVGGLTVDFTLPCQV